MFNVCKCGLVNPPRWLGPNLLLSLPSGCGVKRRRSYPVRSCSLRWADYRTRRESSYHVGDPLDREMFDSVAVDKSFFGFEHGLAVLFRAAPRCKSRAFAAVFDCAVYLFIVVRDFCITALVGHGRRGAGSLSGFWLGRRNSSVGELLSCTG